MLEPRKSTIRICAFALLILAAVAFIYQGELRAFLNRDYTEIRVVQGSNYFDYPVGAPNAKGYYRAQKFGENFHLGEDWNGKGSGNSDYGDPVYAIAYGKVEFCENVGAGWGNVVRIIHPADHAKNIEAVYGHLSQIRVYKGQMVRRGQVIGNIGDDDGQYQAHLHFEIRTKPGLPLGGGYSTDQSGFCDPSDFIDKHRLKN